MDFDDTTLYGSEISGLKKRGYILDIPEKTVFKHLDKRLIATKKVGQHKIKIYMETVPAHFFEIEVPTNEGTTYLLKTGSGNINDYLESLQPAIELIEQSMLVVVEKVTQRK